MHSGRAMKVWCLPILLAVPRLASAGEAPVTVASEPSSYEKETLRVAVARLGAAIDNAPAGKTIEAIEIVSIDPIEERDPLPTALNAVHATTRRYVLAREVLVHSGEVWRQALVDETARNLRRLPQLSVVLVTALVGSAPDRVRLLVVTKDVWSLFVDFDFAVSAGGLERLVLKPREINVAGTQTTAFARFVLEPATWALGAGFIVPRFEGRRLALSGDLNAILNRSSGSLEGTHGTLAVTRPLFSTQTSWAWLTGVTWRDEIARRYTNARVAEVIPGVPWMYRLQQFSQQAAATKSFGWRFKRDVTFGAEITHRAYRAFDDALTPFLPRGERRVGPYAEVREYSTDFLRVIDLDTLGLQEDVILGHEVSLRVYPVTTALGSSRTFLGVRAGAQYTLPLGDGYVRASVVSITESERSRLADASLEASLRIASPRFRIGRLIFDATVLDRYRNHLRTFSLLGGEGRLRGYPTRALMGSDLVAMNLELRTRSFDLASVQTGGVLFYDLGDAFEGFSNLRPKHAIGAGLRFVLPQIDRSVIRFDVAFPMTAGVGAVSTFVSFEHAFTARNIAPPAASTSPLIGGALGY